MYGYPRSSAREIVWLVGTVLLLGGLAASLFGKTSFAHTWGAIFASCGFVISQGAFLARAFARQKPGDRSGLAVFLAILAVVLFVPALLWVSLKVYVGK